MRNAAGESSERIQLLRLANLRLQPAVLRHIPYHADEADCVAFLVVNESTVGGNPPHRLIAGTHDPMLEPEWSMRRPCVLQSLLDLLPILGRSVQVDHLDADRRAGGITDNGVQP